MPLCFTFLVLFLFLAAGALVIAKVFFVDLLAASILAAAASNSAIDISDDATLESACEGEDCDSDDEDDEDKDQKESEALDELLLSTVDCGADFTIATRRPPVLLLRVLLPVTRLVTVLLVKGTVVVVGFFVVVVCLPLFLPDLIFLAILVVDWLDFFLPTITPL